AAARTRDLLGGPAPRAQREALEQLRDALHLHLQPVALAQLCEPLQVELTRGAQVDELVEEPLESGRRDDLEDPGRLVGRVPERVPLVARLEDEIARPRLDDLVAEQRAHPSLDHEAVFVLAGVEVERSGERARRHRVVDDTRRRIVEAAVELHGTIGPSRTTVQAIADRAGVERKTYYRHFRDAEAIFDACKAHYRAQNPLPDPRSWRTAREALDELYG